MDSMVRRLPGIVDLSTPARKYFITWKHASVCVTDSVILRAGTWERAGVRRRGSGSQGGWVFREGVG